MDWVYDYWQIYLHLTAKLYCFAEIQDSEEQQKLVEMNLQNFS